MSEYNWGYPTKVSIVSGVGDSHSEIAAFDAALVNAGIGDVSLIKLTSILPSEVVISNEAPEFLPGSNIPAIYTSFVSSNSLDLIAAAIVIQPTEGGPHLVAEVSGRSMNANQAEKEANEIVGMMARNRSLRITKNPICKSIEHQVKKDHHSAVFVGVVYQEITQR
ncbi:MAG: pyruvoyl-dependent arginine decarboxylase [Candidatus Ranarchaeia archaeon]|jgi:arginine decarboxylase